MESDLCLSCAVLVYIDKKAYHCEVWVTVPLTSIMGN